MEDVRRKLHTLHHHTLNVNNCNCNTMLGIANYCKLQFYSFTPNMLKIVRRKLHLLLYYKLQFCNCNNNCCILFTATISNFAMRNTYNLIIAESWIFTRILNWIIRIIGQLTICEYRKKGFR